MIKNKISLEIRKGERVYELSLQSESPLGECFDVLSEMRAFIIQKIQESNKEPEKPTEE